MPSNILDIAESIVIFGDSFSSSGMSWVSDLISTHLSDTVVVHNFSFAGATAENDLEIQLSRYLSLPSKPWTYSNPKTICYVDFLVFFLGINDCGTTEELLLSEIVEKIIGAADRLYAEVGARNFIFIDVPPIDRSPSGLEHSEIIGTRVRTWNEEMRTHVSQFVEDTPTANVSCFSVHGVLSAILDDPEEYDFTEDDTTVEGGAIWVDELHLTSGVHEIIAEKMASCL